jgi:hypothetical protein
MEGSRSMRLIALGAVLCLFLLSSCGLFPSAEEKAIRDSYNTIADALEQGDFGTAFDNLSANTCQFLNDLAASLTYYEMPMGADGRELFGEMLSEADLTDLSREIKSVTVNGTSATVVTLTEEGDETLQFVLEDGKWKLDFEQLIRDAMDEGLAGSGFTVQDLLDRTVPMPDNGGVGGGVMSVQSGDGSCPVTITNGLGSWTIYYAYVSLSSASEWGDDVLGSDMLSPGGVLTVWVEPGTYDILVEDEDGDTYSQYGIEVGSSGYSWEVTLADMDPSE